ncbi:murein L,D-transpeptidase family protein [Methylobacterium sp. J-076]|uniref:L,D-transpeptidase family protein n=1 Tax=Methylobacterium sp. J-076 TaxID=2836655 RepID=UPI001FB8F464|nr:murein L,D-transpeptidase family protein [Methylobacterium sp. J-076]MCJ2015013.1 murein L,D-transpeptidase [Methylobacterium sp. J-076]
MTARPATARMLAAAALTALLLGACQDGSGINGPTARSIAPIASQTLALMQTKGMQQSDPILIRAYKKEAEMEVWKKGGDGRYALLKTYPICRWSGQLGPKTREGDRQTPEGFYTITPGLMNPNSSYYLSFDTGFPNAVDRANGRSGRFLMVHGTCSSAGCFAMTDASIAEIYAIAREAFSGGQRSFQFQSYPFRMTARNMAKFRNDPNAPFWRNLKEGSDYFEALRDEPKVGACGTRYVFGGGDVAAGSCKPKLDPQVVEKREQDEREIAELVAKGTPSVRMAYQDGGQNPVFRPQNDPTTFASLGGTETVLPYDAKEFGRHNLGDVSRPETLAFAPEEVEIDAKGRPVMLAAAQSPTTTSSTTPKAGTKVGEKAKGPVRPSPTTLMATRQEEPAAEAKPAGAEKPSRLTVADADGESDGYQKLLGTLFTKEKAAPVTPATDAATAAPVKLAAHIEASAPVPAVKTAHGAKPAAHSGKEQAHDAGKPAPAKPAAKQTVAKVDVKP